MASDPGLTTDQIEAIVAEANDNLDYARLAYGKNVPAEYLRQHCGYNIALAAEVKRLRDNLNVSEDASSQQHIAAMGMVKRVLAERDAARAEAAQVRAELEATQAYGDQQRNRAKTAELQVEALANEAARLREEIASLHRIADHDEAQIEAERDQARADLAAAKATIATLSSDHTKETK